MNGSIRRRGKASWELVIDLGRDAQGKRLRKFVNAKGTKAEAQRQLRELLSMKDKGITLYGRRVTVAQWLGKWLQEYVVPNTRQKTYERYAGIVAKHLNPHIGHLQLTELKPNDIQALEAKLLQAGMNPAGVELVHRVLGAALKRAVRMEVLWRNPAQSVTPPRVSRKEVEPPDIQGVRRLLAAAKAEAHPLYPAIHLIAYTGVRRGEVLGLR